MISPIQNKIYSLNFKSNKNPAIQPLNNKDELISKNSNCIYNTNFPPKIYFTGKPIVFKDKNDMLIIGEEILKEVPPLLSSTKVDLEIALELKKNNIIIPRAWKKFSNYLVNPVNNLIDPFQDTNLNMLRSLDKNDGEFYDILSKYSDKKRQADITILKFAQSISFLEEEYEAGRLATKLYVQLVAKKCRDSKIGNCRQSELCAANEAINRNIENFSVVSVEVPSDESYYNLQGLCSPLT